MFPLNDTEPNRYGGSLPVMTLAIIFVNALVLYIDDRVWETTNVAFYVLLFRRAFGSIPQMILGQTGGGALSSLTAMFLHGDILHLSGNMYALWVFGRRVEDACGAWRFLGFYLASGLCADIISTLFRYNSSIPSIGASGALFGVMGAYLLLFPGGKIRTLILLGPVPLLPKLQAFWIVFYFLFLQLIAAYRLLIYQMESRVDYWAHLGGFFSCFLVFFFLRREAFARYLSKTPV